MSIFGFLGDVFSDPESGEVGETVEMFESRSTDKVANPHGYIGLMNQGATCYLNSLLQTMYLTSEFRTRIWHLSQEDLCVEDYMAEKKEKEEQLRKEKEEKKRLAQLGPQPAKEPEKKTSLQAPDEDDLFQEAVKPKNKAPRKTLIELQILFARLKNLDSYAASTSDLTDGFGWGDKEGQARVQHDVQELNRILLQVVDASLQKTEDKELVKELYCGETKLRTHCVTCKQNSDRGETFWDLNLVVDDDHMGVEDALASLTRAEKLEGDNQYRCSMGCDNQKSDAVRSQLLTKLPGVLTFTLMRVVLDYQTMKRKKNCNRFTFPLELDMAPYVHEAPEGEDLTYDLFSVLIHSGNAYSGHYHAYIRESDHEQKGGWYDFNDSTVTAVAPEKLESQFGGTKECAYMLMYRRRVRKTVPVVDPQPWLLERIKQEDAQLARDREDYYKERAALHLKLWSGTQPFQVGEAAQDSDGQQLLRLTAEQQCILLSFDSREPFGVFFNALRKASSSSFEALSKVTKYVEATEPSTTEEGKEQPVPDHVMHLVKKVPFYLVPVMTPFGKGHADLLATAQRRVIDPADRQVAVTFESWGASGFLDIGSVEPLNQSRVGDILDIPMNSLGMCKYDQLLLWNGRTVNNLPLEFHEEEPEPMAVSYDLLNDESGEIAVTVGVLPLEPEMRMGEFVHRLSIFSGLAKDRLVVHIEKASGAFPVDITKSSAFVDRVGIRPTVQLVVEAKPVEETKADYESLAARHYTAKQNIVTVKVVCDGRDDAVLVANKTDTVLAFKIRAAAAHGFAEKPQEELRFRKLIGRDRKADLIFRETETLQVNEIDDGSMVLLEPLKLPSEFEIDALLVVQLKGDNKESSLQRTRIADRMPLLLDKRWTIKQCKQAILDSLEVLAGRKEDEFCLYKGDATYDEKGKLLANEFGLLGKMKLDDSAVLWLEEGVLPIEGLILLHTNSLSRDEYATPQLESKFSLKFSRLSTLADLKRALFGHESGAFAAATSFAALRVHKLTKSGEVGAVIPADSLQLKQQGMNKEEMEICVEVLNFEEKNLSKNAVLLRYCHMMEIAAPEHTTGRIQVKYSKPRVDQAMFDGTDLEAVGQFLAGSGVPQDSMMCLKWFAGERQWRILYRDGRFFPEMEPAPGKNKSKKKPSNNNNNSNQQKQKQGKKKGKQKTPNIMHKPYALSSQDVVAALDAKMVQVVWGSNEDKPLEVKPEETPAAAVTEYACAACTFVNPVANRSCEICGAPSPVEKPKPKKRGIISLGSRWDQLVARLVPPPAIPLTVRKEKEEEYVSKRKAVVEEALQIQYDD